MLTGTDDIIVNGINASRDSQKKIKTTTKRKKKKKKRKETIRRTRTSGKIPMG